MTIGPKAAAIPAARRPAGAVTPEKDAMAQVSFKAVAETRWGDVVVVVGSCEALGEWMTTHGLRMSTDERTYPVWRCPPVALPRTAAEYKLVILRAPEAEPEWEPLAENRILRLDGLDQQVTVAMTWGAASSQVRTAARPPLAPPSAAWFAPRRSSAPSLASKPSAAAAAAGGGRGGHPHSGKPRAHSSPCAVRRMYAHTCFYI